MKAKRRREEDRRIGGVPFPEIAVGLGGERAAETVHLDAERLDLGEVSFDGCRQFWGL